jgi:nitrate/nitrite transporter NarK
MMIVTSSILALSEWVLIQIYILMFGQFVNFLLLPNTMNILFNKNAKNLLKESK